MEKTTEELDRTSIAILGVLYAFGFPNGLPRDTVENVVNALDVDEMSKKEWIAFNRKCRRIGWWKRSVLYQYPFLFFGICLMILGIASLLIFGFFK